MWKEAQFQDNICVEGLRTTQNLRMVSVPAEIHTGEFLNTSQEHWTNMLGGLNVALCVSLSIADDTVDHLWAMLADRMHEPQPPWTYLTELIDAHVPCSKVVQKGKSLWVPGNSTFSPWTLHHNSRLL
jgi:hypothetical protein